MTSAFYFPGKAGDAILQWPVAYHWAKQNAQKIEVWLDRKSCQCLENLFRAQSIVADVRLFDHTKNYSCGGQPWQGDFTTADHIEHTIIPMGLHAFPQRQITMETLQNVPLHVDSKNFATEPVFERSGEAPLSRCVLHGTFQTHMGAVPGFWRFLNRITPELEERFDEIAFVGSPDERERAHELYPKFQVFDDGNDFRRLAEFIDRAQLVIGAGSSVVALAGALKVPAIRVHDAIGEAPKVLWSNLGDNQMNEMEPDLRKLFTPFLEKWVPRAMVV
jgi:hypothetical protein